MSVVSRVKIILAINYGHHLHDMLELIIANNCFLMINNYVTYANLINLNDIVSCNETYMYLILTGELCQSGR